MRSLGHQVVLHELFDASGTVGATSTLALPLSMSRDMLLIANTGSTTLAVEFGPARATCTVVSGAVSTVTVGNAGQNYSYPPIVEFLGGGDPPVGTYGKAGFLGIGQDGGPSPSKPATAHCVMTGTAPNLSVSSVVIDDGGAGYVCPPYVYLRNDQRDPNGVAIATVAGGIPLIANSAPLRFDGSFVPTDAISIISSAAGGTYCLKYAT